MKRINLSQYSVDDLLSLRDRLNAALASRVDREQQQLESRLKRLQRFKAATVQKTPSSAPRKAATRKRKTKSNGKVAPKYRNPANPSETWAGRGLQPRWLKAALNGGKVLTDFRI